MITGRVTKYASVILLKILSKKYLKPNIMIRITENLEDPNLEFYLKAFHL